MYREEAENLTFRTKYTHPPKGNKIGEMDFEILNYRLKSKPLMNKITNKFAFSSLKTCICKGI